MPFWKIRPPADDIVVLRAGRIVEQGAHEALMRRAGLYATLYASAHGSFDDLRAEEPGLVAT